MMTTTTAAVAKATAPVSSSSSADLPPLSPCGAPKEDFLQSLSALRQLLNVNYDCLDEEVNALSTSKSTTPLPPPSSTFRQQLQQQLLQHPPETSDRDDVPSLLRQELEATRKELEREKTQRLKMEVTQSQLVEQKQDLSKRIQSLSSLQSLQEDFNIARARWREERDKNQRDQQKLKQALEQIATERSQALQKLDVGQTKILALQKQVRELQAQQDSSREQWESERSQLQETIRTLEMSRGSLQDRLEEQSEFNHDVQERLEAMQRDYVRMQAVNAECQEIRRQSVEEVAKMRDEMTMALSHANGWRRTLDQTDRVLQENNREIVELQQRLEEERNEHDQTKQKLQLVSNTNESKRRQEQGQQEQFVQQLEQKIMELTQQLKDRVQRKLNDQRQQTELISQIKARDEQLVSKEREIQLLKQKQESLTKLEASNRARIEALRKSVTTFKTQSSETEKLKDELSQTKGYLHTAQTEIQQALAQLSSVLSAKAGSIKRTSSTKLTLGELITQLIEEKEQQQPRLKQLSPSIVRTSTRPPSPNLTRHRSPRKILTQQDTSMTLGKRTSSAPSS